MRDTPRSIVWEAPEHDHRERSADWYWILGIIAVAAAIASIIFGNVLLAVIIILSASTIALFAYHPPRIHEFEVSLNHIRIDNTFHPYPTLESFYIDTVSINAPQLIVKSKGIFIPLLFLPLPIEYIDAIDDIVAPRLYEEHLEEPLLHQLLEIFGF